jgi:hypothetical protein
VSTSRAEIEYFSLSSSALSSGAYDPVKQTLDITFTNGRTYTHYDVPPDVVAALRASPSPGSFYNDEIKGVYV